MELPVESPIQFPIKAETTKTRSKSRPRRNLGNGEAAAAVALWRFGITLLHLDPFASNHKWPSSYATPSM